VINICCYYREKSEDSFSLVVEKAFATHMCCVLTWNAGFCAYPWSLSSRQTTVFGLPLSKQQERELVQWRHVAGEDDRIVSYIPVVRPSQLDLKRWWIVPFSAKCRSSRRCVVFLCCDAQAYVVQKYIFATARVGCCSLSEGVSGIVSFVLM
jgi:hypothetical protein